MNYIHIRRFGLATGLTAALLYMGCAIVMYSVGHDGTIKFFNTLLHGLDTTSIIRMEITVQEELLGIAQTFILGWFVGALIAAFYNLTFKSK